MTESSGSKRSTVRTGLFIVVGSVLLLAIVFASGYFILPNMIRSAYEQADCETAISRQAFFVRFYSVFNAEATQDSQIMECAVFLLADREEQNGNLNNAYEAYRVYVEMYPEGLFVDEANAQGAAILVQFANEQATEKQYDQALMTLELLSSKYPNSSAVTEGVDLYPQIYQSWGTDRRAAGDFSGAERVFGELLAWAQARQGTELVTSAQRELAQTYLSWGRSLQTQLEFADALTKFDQALATNPEIQSASQAQVDWVAFYRAWGDQLLAQGEFGSAMELYQTAAGFSQADPAAAQDILAGGYIQWATEATTAEDFIGALVLLDFAEAKEATAETKAQAETTRAEVYAAFSQSSGAQAQIAIQNAVRIVCEHQAQPRLPIFGLDQENVRAGVSGVDAKLPESIVATNPAALHYVACVDEEPRVVGTLRLPISTTTFGGPPGVVQITYVNYQYVWNVTLRQVETGEQTDTTILEGVKPADLIPFNITATVFSYYGAKPDVAKLAEWIQSAIE